MTEKQTQETQRKASETMTEKPSSFYVDVKPKGKLHSWLIKRKLSPSRHYFEIRPQRVVNIYRMAGRAVSLDVAGIMDSVVKDSVGTINKIMSSHGEDIFYIVACAIQNDHREPTEKLLDIVRNDFEMQDIFTVMNIAVGMYNVQAFLNSIALMVGVDALNLKASPEVKGG